MAKRDEEVVVVMREESLVVVMGAMANHLPCFGIKVYTPQEEGLEAHRAFLREVGWGQVEQG